jgi:leader peptidase (prepilin peptidase) / N-methyltransferase
MRVSAGSGPGYYGLLAAVLFLVAAIPALHVSELRLDIVVLSLGLGAVLVAASAIDWDRYLLPDVLMLPLIAAGLPVSWWLGQGTTSWCIVSAAVGYGVIWGLDQIYLTVRGRHGIGMGDAKLLAAAGAWMGAEALPMVLLWATGLALTASLVASAGGREISSGGKIPFGPALALGFWVTWLYGGLA